MPDSKSTMVFILTFSILFLSMLAGGLYSLRLLWRFCRDVLSAARLPAEDARSVSLLLGSLLGLVVLAGLCSVLLMFLSFNNPSLDIGDSVSRLLLGMTGLSILSVPIFLQMLRRLFNGTSGVLREVLHESGHLQGSPVRIEAGFLPDGGKETDPVDLDSKSLERFQLLAERIRSTMEERKPYLDPAFTLEDLARLLGVPKHHIYHCLNGILNIRFTRLRAEYRIGHAKYLIDEGAGSEKSLQRIGMESGFSSRSSFITAFREVTGHTPGEYLRTLGSMTS